MKILMQQLEQSKGRQVRKDLNSILKEWTFGNQPLTSAPQFLTKFRPWISERIKESQEVQALLERKGVNNLSEIN